MNFNKTFWACFLAFFVATVASSIFNLILWISIMGAISSMEDSDKAELKDNSVLKIDLSEAISEKQSGSPLDMFDMQSMTFNHKTDIVTVLDAVKAAADEPQISGIVLTAGSTTQDISMDHAYQLRSALKDFHEKSGKFILAFGDTFSQTDLWLCSVADNIYVNPQGAVEWYGLSGQLMFFKDALDKLGVEPQIFRVGRFKSAVEPFMRSEMSDANRLQNQEMLNSIWKVILEDVAKSREIEPSVLDGYAGSLDIIFPEDALARGLVDSLVYKNDFEQYLAGLVSAEKPSKINYLSPSDYSKSVPSPNYSASKVAVLVTQGEMVVEKSSGTDNIVGQDLADEIDKLREDSTVKAVVLRIDSPGGSVLAAATAYNSMLKLKAVKPVVVSMGEYAASGGYYVSAPADAIVASPVTLTGSIGVFSVVFNFGKALKQVLGVNIQSVATHTNSAMSMVEPLNQRQQEIMQKGVEKVYREFVTLVSEGRGMTFEAVDSIAGGRVWTGAQAKEIGLVDELGTLDDAVALAARKAGLEEYRKVMYPKESDGFSAIFNEMFSAKIRMMMAPECETIEAVREQILRREGIQAIVPYMIEIK